MCASHPRLRPSRGGEKKYVGLLGGEGPGAPTPHAKSPGSRRSTWSHRIRNTNPAAAQWLALALLLVLAGCYLPTATLPPAATATAVPPTEPATPSVPTLTETALVLPTDTEAAATATATAAPLDTITPTPEPTAPVTISLPAWAEQMLWLPGGTELFGESYPTNMLVIRSGKTCTVIDPANGTITAAGDLSVPNTVLAVSPDFTSALSATEGPLGGPGIVSSYNLDGTLRFTLPDTGWMGLGYTQKGEFITGEGSDVRAIRVFDPNTGALVHDLTGFESAAPVYLGYIVPGGKTAIWQARATIQIQDVETGVMGARLSYQDFVMALAFSPDGTRMAVSVEDQLLLYSLPSGAEIQRITRSQPVNSLAFSPDGSLLAAGYGPDIQLWDAASLAPRAALPGPNTFTGQVSFSPGGTYLAALHEPGSDPGQVLTIHAIILE